jgi:P2-related tail formation protein
LLVGRGGAQAIFISLRKLILNIRVYSVVGEWVLYPPNGDRYYFGKDVKYSGKIFAGYADLTFLIKKIDTALSFIFICSHTYNSVDIYDCTPAAFRSYFPDSDYSFPVLP